MEIPVGHKGYAECIVAPENTAAALCSGTLPVFGTPYMITLIETAASRSLQEFLDETQSSVGTHLDVAHLAPTPLGMKVWAESVVTKVEGRKITFDVKAYDECGLIGEGTHERFIIFSEKFMAKCEAKKKA